MLRFTFTYYKNPEGTRERGDYYQHTGRIVITSDEVNLSSDTILLDAKADISSMSLFVSCLDHIGDEINHWDTAEIMEKIYDYPSKKK